MEQQKLGCLYIKLLVFGRHSLTKNTTQTTMIYKMYNVYFKMDITAVCVVFLGCLLCARHVKFCWRSFQLADLAIKELLVAQQFKCSIACPHTVNPITLIYKKNISRDSAICLHILTRKLVVVGFASKKKFFLISHDVMDAVVSTVSGLSKQAGNQRISLATQKNVPVTIISYACSSIFSNANEAG